MAGMVVALSLAAVEEGRTLSLWDCETVRDIQALEVERDLVHEGTAAVRWRNHPERPNFDVDGLAMDWTEYSLLKLWIRSSSPLPGASRPS